MTAVRTSFAHRVEYAVLRTVMFITGLLPLRCALSMGACMGWFAWCVLGVRRKVVMRNLALAFPGDDDRSRSRTALLSYMNVGRFMMEFARQGSMSREYVLEHVEVEDPGRLEDIRQLGGCIVITGHFGSWELFGVAMGYLLGRMSFLVGRQSNALVDDFINHLRSRHGIELFNRRTAVRGVVTSIRSGGRVCWLSDQDAGSSGVIVDFFGHPASTPRGAAAFSVRLGAPVIAGALVRQGKGPFHRLVLSPTLLPDASLPREAAEEDITRRYTTELETLVRAHPEQYWWAHRRWKSTGVYGDQAAAADPPRGKGN